MVGTFLSGNLRRWLDRGHAADVRLDWITFCVELAKLVWTSSSAANGGGGTEHRFWTVVRV